MKTWLLALTLVLRAAAPVAAEETVKVGDLPALSTAAFYIAIEKGYFAERGLRIETEVFASAGKMTPALATGHIDVATGAPSAGLFKNNASGPGVKIVAGKGGGRPGVGGA